MDVCWGTSGNKRLKCKTIFYSKCNLGFNGAMAQWLQHWIPYQWGSTQPD